MGVQVIRSIIRQGWAHFLAPRIDLGVGASDPPRRLGFKMENHLDWEGCLTTLFVLLEIFLVVLYFIFLQILKV